MSRDPPLIGPTIYRIASASNITAGSQPLLGYDQVASQSPTSHNPVSLSPRHLPQLVPQKSNYGSAATLSPKSKGVDLELDESDDAKPGVISQATIQDPPLGTDYHRSSKSHRNIAASETSPAHIDPLPHSFDNIQTSQAHNPDYGHTQRAGMSRTNLPSTPGGKNALTRDVRDTGSRKL